MGLNVDVGEGLEVGLGVGVLAGVPFIDVIGTVTVGARLDTL